MSNESHVPRPARGAPGAHESDGAEFAPHLGMAFGLVLFWASWKIIRDALHILLQGTPEGTDLDEVVAAIRAIAGVSDVHHVHAWSRTSGRNVFTAATSASPRARTARACSGRYPRA